MTTRNHSIAAAAIASSLVLAIGCSRSDRATPTPQTGAAPMPAGGVTAAAGDVTAPMPNVVTAPIGNGTTTGAIGVSATDGGLFGDGGVTDGGLPDGPALPL